MPIADVLVPVLAIVMSLAVVAVVIGLHVWGAIQDGREEKSMRAWRRRRR